MNDIVSLRLDADTRKRLDELAVSMERSRASLAAEAVKQYIATQEWQIAAIHDGIASAEHNEFVDHAELKAKWEKRLATALDKAR